MKIFSGKNLGVTIGKNRDGTRDVRLSEAEITSPEDIQTVELVSRAGEDSNPPVGARLIILQIGTAWKIAIADEDFVDPSVDTGGKRIYSTNAAGEEVKAEVRLQPDGKMEIKNAIGKIEIFPDGRVIINDINLLTHVHPVTSAPGTTGPMQPGPP